MVGCGIETGPEQISGPLEAALENDGGSSWGLEATLPGLKDQTHFLALLLSVVAARPPADGQKQHDQSKDDR